MAISDTEKLDFLWKKVIFGTSKTAGSTTKFGSNETVASPLPVYSTNIWTQTDSVSIPAVPPASTTSIVQKYYGAQRIAMTMDPTSPVNQSWLANLGNFIPTTFGSSYLVRVWLGDPNGSKAARIFPDTTNQEYVFDYVSGVLNFTGTIPSGIAATIGTGTVSVAVDGVYIEAYRYIGTTLDTTIGDIGSAAKTSVVANIAARDALTSMVAGDIVYVTDASGDPSAAGPGEFATYLYTGSGWQVIATKASSRTDALTTGVDVDFADFGADMLIGNVGNGTRVVEVSVEVLTPFDGDADFEIGDATVNNRLLDMSEVDLQTTGIYLVQPVYQFPAGGNVDVKVYFTGTPTTGTAKVTITWA